MKEFRARNQKIEEAYPCDMPKKFYDFAAEITNCIRKLLGDKTNE